MSNREMLMENSRNAHQLYTFRCEKENFPHQFCASHNPEQRIKEIEAIFSVGPLTVLKQKRGFIIYNVVLGKGGNGKVYLGKKKETGQSVAIKEIKNKETTEIKNNIKLSSPYTIKMYDFWFQTAAK